MLSDWSMSGQVYYGSEDSEPNKLLSDFFFLKNTREAWKDIGGIMVQFSKDGLDIHLTHMQYTNERYIDGIQQEWNGDTQRKGKCYGLSINIDYENFLFLSELNRLDLDVAI